MISQDEEAKAVKGAIASSSWLINPLDLYPPVLTYLC
jgi:hypothetical protein